MKKLSTIALIAFTFLLVSVPALSAEENEPEALIARARAVVLTPDPGRDAITKALVDVLDASLLILPKTTYASEFKSRVDAVRIMFAEGAIFEDKARQYLGLAYKLVSGGNAWKIPEELTASGPGSKSIEQATKICAKLLDSALAAHKAGRSEESVRDLLGMVILVVTPIDAGR